MRELFLSICEKTFIQKIIAEGQRLDGRSYHESRALQISFGSEYGSCIVSLGATRVLAQVSCEVVQPKQIRPNEGVLYINVEIGPMAAPHFESNRQTDLSVYLNRLLEKCFKDSKCIDLESLCIVVEEKVWSLRVDIKVLNHAGNLIECTSIAALTSLAHFKRPDVTRSGDSVTIHTLAEKDPIPTVLYHYPVCLTFAIFGTDILISDPSFIEESVCTSNGDENINSGGGVLVVGMNQYRELCLLDLTGAAIQSSDLVDRATHSAALRCKEIVDLIKQEIATDDLKRQKRIKVNFSEIITKDHIMSLCQKELNICLRNFKSKLTINSEEEDATMEEDVSQTEDLTKYDVNSSRGQIVELVQKEKVSSWIEVSSDSEDD